MSENVAAAAGDAGAAARDAASPSMSTSTSTASTLRAPPLGFGSDRGDMPFPTAGAVLLVTLLAIAAWAWWHAQRRGAGSGGTGSIRRFASGMAAGGPRRPRWWASLDVAQANGAAARLITTTRIDVHGRLHVIEWRGEELLLGVNGGTPPVVLARRMLEPTPTDVAAAS